MFQSPGKAPTSSLTQLFNKNGHASPDSLTSPVGSQTAISSALLAVGGVDMQSFDDAVPGKCVYKYTTESNTWSPITLMKDYLHHHGAVVVGQFLYVAGIFYY